MDWTLLISTLLQVIAACWAGYLYGRQRNWQAFFLLLLFTLMALRRVVDLAGGNTPGAAIGPITMHSIMQLIVLVISVMSVTAVGFLHVYFHRRTRGEREVRLLSSAFADSATPTLISRADSDPNGLIIEFVNDAMLALTGFERAEMVGKPMSEVFGFAEASDAAARVRAAISGGKPIVTECATRRKDGTHRWVNCSMSPIRDEAGPISRLLWFKHDITDRRHIEEQLRREQQRYQRIVETAAEGVWLVDEKWHTTYVNARMAEMLGHPPEAMIGRHITEFVYESDLSALEANMKSREHGRSGRHDERLRRADGSELWTIMSTNAFLDEAGRFEGALAMVTDIGDRRTTEATLRAALQTLSFHMNNSPLAVVECDREFRVGTWSSGAERIFGWKAEEVIGKHPVDWRIVHEDDAEMVAGFVNRLHTGAEPRNLCLNRNYTKSGEVIWCQWYNSVLFDPDGRVNSVVSLAQDVTERHLAEDRQRLLMLELDHRVKNNLAAVLGIAQQSLAASTSLDDFAPSFIGRIESLARAHGLLARASWEGVDLLELCNRILESGTSGPAPRITASGPPVSLSASQGSILALTLHELMTNAAKYGALSTPQGNVEIRWNAQNRGHDLFLELNWSERNGPPVAAPHRAGFGTNFVETATSYELGGTAAFGYDVSGLTCKIVIPLSSKPRFTPDTTALSGATA